jgi:uncharacterized protein YdeI (YjbR/CyaY-like superfamily)
VLSILILYLLRNDQKKKWFLMTNLTTVIDSRQILSRYVKYTEEKRQAGKWTQWRTKNSPKEKANVNDNHVA